MHIHVNAVPAQGLERHARYDPAPLDMERQDVRLREPFEVSAVITRVEGTLFVQAAIRCPLRLLCARCLEEFDRAVVLNTAFNYRVRPTDVVDITDDVRQEILLAYPMIPICNADCKGLCRSCGQNLNHGACDCHQRRRQ